MFSPHSAAEAEHLDFYQELLGSESDLEYFEALDERPLGNAGLNFYWKGHRYLASFSIYPVAHISKHLNIIINSL